MILETDSFEHYFKVPAMVLVEAKTAATVP